MARVLIAGCGYVGAALAARLVRSGHRVWGLRRRSGATMRGVHPIAADLAVPSTLTDLSGPFDFVFHTAAADAVDDESYRRIYVEGSRNLLASVETAGALPRRVFFTSSTSVYGQDSGEWVDESSEATATHFRARRVLQGENLFFDGPFPATVVRFGGIYGPGRYGLVDRVREGRVPLASEPPRYTNRIHRDDAAGLLEHLMGLPEPDALYLGVDSEPASLQTIACWMTDRLGPATPGTAQVAVPDPEPPGTGKRCSNRRLLAEGYRLIYPTFREGFAEPVRSRTERGE